MAAPVELQLNSMGTDSAISSGCNIRDASRLGMFTQRYVSSRDEPRLRRHIYNDRRAKAHLRG